VSLVCICSGVWGGEGSGVEVLIPDEEHNDLYCLPNIVRGIKSRRIRWAVHVVHMAEG